jgi:hypothetical protein
VGNGNTGSSVPRRPSGDFPRLTTELIIPAWINSILRDLTLLLFSLSFMNKQILASSGASVLSRKECNFIGEIEPGGKTIVSWRDTEWFLKVKDWSANEVIGYQLAEFLSLPVQPWLAVELDEIEDTGIEKPNLGILIQKWDDKSRCCPLDFPQGKHPALVGKALALNALNPHDPEWMMNAGMTELRLIDLEFFGPAIYFSELTFWNDLVEGYLEGVGTNVCRNYRSANHAEAIFRSTLARLIEVDLMGIVNFSGHSRACEIAEMAASFLKPAQGILSSFVHGIAL